MMTTTQQPDILARLTSLCYMAVAVGFFIAAVVTIVKVVIKMTRAEVTLRTPHTVEGLIFGKIGPLYVCSPSTAEGHCYIAGPSGSGKSVWLKGALEGFHGSVFAIDIDGSLTRGAHMLRKLVIDFANQNTLAWDVLWFADNARTEADRQAQLEMLADHIMPVDDQSTRPGDWYRSQGKKILKACLLAFADRMTLPEIARLVTDSSYSVLFTEIDKSDVKAASDKLTGFQGNENRIPDCLQACEDALAPFLLPAAQHIFRSSTNAISPRDIETGSIFLVCPDEKLELYSALLAVITRQMAQYITAREPRPHDPVIACVLDEFASLRIDAVPWLRKFRKHKARILIASQGITGDIEALYQDEAARRAFFANFKHTVVLGATDPDDQMYLARRIGKEYRSGNSVWEALRTSPVKTLLSTPDANENTEEGWKIPPEELAHLRGHIILIHPDGHMRLQKYLFYKKRPF